MHNIPAYLTFSLSATQINMVEEGCWFSQINVFHENFPHRINVLFFSSQFDIHRKELSFFLCQQKHFQFGTLSQPCSNRTFSNCRSCWSVRSCRFNATGGHVRNKHGARTPDNPHTVSCATPDAALIRAKLQRDSHICIALPSTSLAWRDHFVLLKCSPAFGALRLTRRTATRDLQQCDNFFLWHVFRVHGLHALVRKTEASQRLIHRSTSALLHTSLSRFSLCLSPWMVRGPSTIPTLFGASVYLETLGAFSHRGSLSDKSLQWLMKSEPGHLDVFLDLLGGGTKRGR